MHYILLCITCLLHEQDISTKVHGQIDCSSCPIGCMLSIIFQFLRFFCPRNAGCKGKKISDGPLRGSYQECRQGLLTRILVEILTKFLVGDFGKVLGGIFMATLPLFVARILARILAGTLCGSWQESRPGFPHNRNHQA